MKFLIEGEEEVGSEHLEPFVEANRDQLACDCVVISDCCQFAPGLPAITYGLRGIAYYRVAPPRTASRICTRARLAAAVTNPANALVALLAALKDEDGRIQVPGFYDDVVPLTEREREDIVALPLTEDEFMEQLGVNGLSGEAGYTTLERRWARPTCDINGLTSGYQGEGAKTVLPAQASAKVQLPPGAEPRPAEDRRIAAEIS